MIKEDYISFETAKLLKEKGFNEPTFTYYNNAGDIMTSYDFCGDYISGRFNGIKDEKVNCAAPTLQMAMKWLRNVHKKVINVEYIDFLEHGEVWSYSILDRNTFHEFTEKSESFTEHSYEEACEEAIKYCLENLI